MPSSYHWAQRGALAAAIIAFAIGLLISMSPAFAQVVAIRAGTIVDPAQGTSAKDQVILIEHGKIKSIGSHTAIPADAEIIDLSKEWVTAGLMDAHTHMTLSAIGSDAPFESF